MRVPVAWHPGFLEPGIGAGIAKELAAAGAAVVVDYGRDKDGADAVVEHITSNGGRAIAVQADVSNKEDVDRLFETAKETFGPIDILVNNAAVFTFEPVEQVTPEQFLRHYEVNVLGDLLTIQKAIEHFEGKGGSIINLTSQGASNPPLHSVAYSSTKEPSTH
ncbi:SDR family NAD(P)-dependent oxidoreductase [Streptomyces sp. RS2]|nr:SDR family NAD(P)-dependent oxidoreductase [Streptomyces sp. RS2]MCW1100282.1 SDR family NAD(P)-dependent oxidoreductase [Streptomyces sp. RS2]